MLGEFRKVCEWEVGGRIGKSYFRLSPYERKIHRLPASFDEEVYDELSKFMGLRRSPAKIAAAAPQCRGAAAAAGDDGLNSPDTMKSLTLLLPPPSKDDFDGPEECQLKLGWSTRHKICVGKASGLAYLHEESRLKIVHRDIKATNVLLDTDLNPKIPDFGLAKLVGWPLMVVVPIANSQAMTAH